MHGVRIWEGEHFSPFVCSIVVHEDCEAWITVLKANTPAFARFNVSNYLAITESSDKKLTLPLVKANCELSLE